MLRFAATPASSNAEAEDSEKAIPGVGCPVAFARVTLHEAMVEVLRSHGGGWMARDEIAREIARRDLFRRPSDGQPPPSDQLRLRARKPEYQHLFECSDTACTRIRLRSSSGSASIEAGRAPAARRVSVSASAVKARRAVTQSAPSPSDSAAWYEQLRERYRPERLRVLLVAESPPDPGDGERRFFYSPELWADNLYRGVAQALYGEHDKIDILDKPAVLDRIRVDGFWLIDAVDEPINKVDSAARARAIAAGVPGLVERCLELVPELGVIICHGKVYAAAAQPLREAGVVLLHDEPLPFPLGNWRSDFISGFRRAVEYAPEG